MINKPQPPGRRGRRPLVSSQSSTVSRGGVSSSTSPTSKPLSSHVSSVELPAEVIAKSSTAPTSMSTERAALPGSNGSSTLSKSTSSPTVHTAQTPRIGSPAFDGNQINAATEQNSALSATQSVGSVDYWEAFVEPTSGRTYFHNKRTNVTQWDDPKKEERLKEQSNAGPSSSVKPSMTSSRLPSTGSSYDSMPERRHSETSHKDSVPSPMDITAHCVQSPKSPFLRSSSLSESTAVKRNEGPASSNAAPPFEKRLSWIERHRAEAEAEARAERERRRLLDEKKRKLRLAQAEAAEKELQQRRSHAGLSMPIHGTSPDSTPEPSLPLPPPRSSSPKAVLLRKAPSVGSSANSAMTETDDRDDQQEIDRAQKNAEPPLSASTGEAALLRTNAKAETSVSGLQVPDVPLFVSRSSGDELQNGQKDLKHRVKLLLKNNRIQMEEFQTNTRLFGLDFLSARDYFQFLTDTLGPFNTFQHILPDLLRLLPDNNKQRSLMDAAREWRALHKHEIEKDMRGGLSASSEFVDANLAQKGGTGTSETSQGISPGGKANPRSRPVVTKPSDAADQLGEAMSSLNVADSQAAKKSNTKDKLSLTHHSQVVSPPKTTGMYAPILPSKESGKEQSSSPEIRSVVWREEPAIVLHKATLIRIEQSPNLKSNAYSESEDRNAEKAGSGSEEEGQAELQDVETLEAVASVNEESACSDWLEAIDASSGRRYFYNSRTGESQWHPPSVALHKEVEASDSLADFSEGFAESQWQEFVEEETGRRYYHNAATGVTQWEKP